MYANELQKIELEITSGCNAACPGCARTQNIDNLKIQQFSLNDLKKIFSSKEFIQDKKFKFCGVLGDPILNAECKEMIEYLIVNDAYCEISTNGGYQSAEWWSDLGKISRAYPGKLHIHFCVDGHKETNHIYRVNTKFNIIERNMIAYSQYAPANSATWVYIVFDHNEHELEIAQSHAELLKFEFATRTGMRNSYHDWVSLIGKKNSKQEKIITTTGLKEHSKKKQVQELDQFIEKYESSYVDESSIKKITDSITCKYFHEREIFIASDLTLWPCCFLWDSAFKNKENILDKLSIFDNDWNNLKIHSINEILDHPWYKKLLIESWHPYNNLHLSRCIRTCAKNKAYHNEFKKL
jgi:MoaA/NifB/PqqE/SkfB family radical SAM enzyme